ncbi:uncharacterized protein LOC117343619 [Pecten maximus]|uniref:uncharacterized protein LOC117343619 n=1 Tax=Pecten maximus TaxID=6579 RepID=UPI00145821E2|nr:uncharacterized protein LOC117343619 [Pecten maximus]XP_033761946.1 uncharacterized protein LOC117343619 [Pecten maximus]
MSATKRQTDGQGSRTETVVSGSRESTSTPLFSGEGHSLVSEPQSPMEVGGATGGQSSIDWQFYFDTLAPELSEKLDELVILLEIKTGIFNNIKKEHQHQHEICFHLLWTWHKNSTKSGKNDSEKLKNLHQALKDIGLHILTQEEIPSRGNYQFTGEVISGTTSFKEDTEVLKVAKRTLSVSLRLGRFFGLKEEDIQRVVSNNRSDIAIQARYIIKACTNSDLLRTRQDLCNGLNYIQDTEMIDKMNKDWLC